MKQYTWSQPPHILDCCITEQHNTFRRKHYLPCLDAWTHSHPWLASVTLNDRGVMPFIPPKEHSQFFSLDYLDGWLWNCQDSDLWSPEDLLLCNLIAESSLQPCNQGSSEIWKVVSNKFVRWCQINLLDQIGWLTSYKQLIGWCLLKMKHDWFLLFICDGITIFVFIVHHATGTHYMKGGIFGSSSTVNCHGSASEQLFTGIWKQLPGTVRNWCGRA